MQLNIYIYIYISDDVYNFIWLFFTAKVKCEVTKQISQRTIDGRYQAVFDCEVLHVAMFKTYFC